MLMCVCAFFFMCCPPGRQTSEPVFIDVVTPDVLDSKFQSDILSICILYEPGIYVIPEYIYYYVYIHIW